MVMATRIQAILSCRCSLLCRATQTWRADAKFYVDPIKPPRETAECFVAQRSTLKALWEYPGTKSVVLLVARAIQNDEFERNRGWLFSPKRYKHGTQGVASSEDGREYLIRQPGTHPRLRPVD